MSGMPGPEFFLLVIDDGKVVRIPGEAKAREEWCAVCREREFCFSCMKKNPGWNDCHPGVCLRDPAIF